MEAAGRAQSRVGDDPLAWLARRKGADGSCLIDAAQLAAGERFRQDFDVANLSPRVTSGWDHGVRVSGLGGRGDGRAAVIDVAMAARRRFEAALAAVGPELAPVLTEVCCRSQGLEAVERQFQWPARSGKLMLQVALKVLARHYGLAMPAGASETRRMRHQRLDHRASCEVR